MGISVIFVFARGRDPAGDYTGVYEFFGRAEARVRGVTVAKRQRGEEFSPSGLGGGIALKVFRAHEALRRQVLASCGTCADHGCLDCSCGERESPAGSRGYGSRD